MQGWTHLAGCPLERAWPWAQQARNWRGWLKREERWGRMRRERNCGEKEKTGSDCKSRGGAEGQQTRTRAGLAGDQAGHERAAATSEQWENDDEDAAREDDASGGTDGQILKMRLYIYIFLYTLSDSILLFSSKSNISELFFLTVENMLLVSLRTESLSPRSWRDSHWSSPGWE